MNYRLSYGKKYKDFEIDSSNILFEVRQNQITGVTGNETIPERDVVRKALDNPRGTPGLSDIVSPGEKVVVITSDITRPFPGRIVMPEVLGELAAAGIPDSDITIVFATGSHRRQTVEEKIFLVGEDIYGRIRCIDSDPDDCLAAGMTAMGTPVGIFSEVLKADRRICLGNIEYHYFAGYSGGAKAIMPGVSTRNAITANHSAMVRDNARTGIIEGNPVREDIEEAIKFCHIDFILNVVLDEHKKITGAFAGHYIEAHREGCRFLDKLNKVAIPSRAGIVIASPGGYPKDINLYQSQKALDNAAGAVMDGGVIILCASCSEGMGEKVFEKWMFEYGPPGNMINKIQKNFELGGHKAAAIAMVLKKADIYLVSDLDSVLVRKIYMKPFTEVGDALDAAYGKLGRNTPVILMPAAGSTLPEAP